MFFGTSRSFALCQPGPVYNHEYEFIPMAPGRRQERPDALRDSTSCEVKRLKDENQTLKKALSPRRYGFRTDKCFLTAVYLNCGGLPIDEALDFAL